MTVYNKTLSVAILCMTALAYGSCTENTICIDYGSGTSGSGNNGGNTSGETTLVTFHASIEGRNMTRALSPVRKNVQAQLFAFDGTAANAAGMPADQGAYLSMTPGLLQGINGFRMHLPRGVYNFYGVSDNTQYSAPTFSAGISEPLHNETDYLWWRGVQQDVTSDLTGIPIVFLHSATQVLFEVSEGPGIRIDRLVLAHIYPPVTGARMNLTSGVIPPAATYQTTVSKMGINGMLVQYTMLPVKTDEPLLVSFDIFINGERTARTYDVEVSLPNGELAAGDSYRFKAVIQGDEIVFPSVSVVGWVDVDETGKPLYPTEN